jgi:acetylornithine deacetylase/succinyl-diaminopimelate desuccinylase-like protein
MTDSISFVRDFVDRHFAAQCELLAAMVRIPTDNPPGDCAPHAEAAAQRLQALGLGVERFAVPQAAVDAAGMTSALNLVVRQRFGEGPCIALNAHGDVVPPGLGWTHDPHGATVTDDAVHGPVMYGRGAAVSKSDFATYTYALLALQAWAAKGNALAGSIELHLTYDEETGGDIGPRWLLEQNKSKPDYCIGAGFSYAVITAHNGCLHLEVTLRGRPGHAAMPESGIDALAAATAVLTILYASRQNLSERSSRVAGISHPTLNVGLIAGGINTNVVPDKVTFRLDRRIIPEESPPEVEAQLRGLLEAAAAQFPGIHIEIRRVLLALPLVKLPGAERLTQSLQKYGAHFLATDIAEHGVPLYTDARHYTAAGIPTVLYGAGPRTLREANGHGADECLRLRDLRGATATLACALIELLSGGSLMGSSDA